MSARITRSQAKAQIAAPVKAPAKTVKAPVKKSQVKSQPKSWVWIKKTEDEICNLEKKEAELAAREAALLKKESELVLREAALLKKEAELEAALKAKPAKKEAKKTGKQFMINFLSDYQGTDAQSEVFISSDEKTAALAAFDWMVENREGLDFEMALYTLEIEGNNRFEDEEELTAHVRKSCNSFKDLKKICERYGNSYFEDYDGWKLKFSQK